MVDVVVVGAGISGAATAYELATSGHSVALVDRYGPAAMASGWTLAGVRQSGRDPAELPLAQAAVAIWADLHERLDAPTHYRRGGNLRLGRTPRESTILREIVRAQSEAGLAIEYLDGSDAVRAVAPAVTDAVTGATYCPGDGHADPHAAVRAYVDAAARAGAQLRFGETALRIEATAGRVTGVTTSAGFLPAAHVVLAAGFLGNELLRPLGLVVPIEVRTVTVVRTRPASPVLSQVIGVASAECAGRQEVTGRFRFTNGGHAWNGRMEDGERPVVRPATGDVADTIGLFGALVPATREAEIEEVWAGLIDMTPDALPVLQAHDEPRGLVVAMGFSGHGFCLGPITGRIMAALVEGRDCGLKLEPFRLGRFAGRNDPTSLPSLHG